MIVEVIQPLAEKVFCRRSNPCPRCLVLTSDRKLNTNARLRTLKHTRKMFNKIKSMLVRKYQTEIRSSVAAGNLQNDWRRKLKE